MRTLRQGISWVPGEGKHIDRNVFQELKHTILPTLKQILTDVQTVFRFYEKNSLFYLLLSTKNA